MKNLIGTLVILILLVFAFDFLNGLHAEKPNQVLSAEESRDMYWFLLHRKSNVEFLYLGTPGDIAESELIREFNVKTGIPKEKPTPLPQLLGRKYWVVVGKTDEVNDETAPYFLTLDVPVSEDPPFGPVPYKECEGDPASAEGSPLRQGFEGRAGEANQCNWELPGAFGLHGVNGDMSRLSDENSGSSGCIRHRDEDITYLYDLLEPEKDEIRYYIKDI